MQLKDDEKRNKVRWKYLNGANDYFYIDFYSYATVEMNIRRAVKSKDNMNMYYDREGWIRLLIYYSKALEELVYTYTEAWYIVPQKIMSEIAYLERIPICVHDHIVMHDTTLPNNEILKMFIMIAKYIQCIIKTVNDIDLSDLEKQIRIIENGDDKQEYSETNESELEEMF